MLFGWQLKKLIWLVFSSNKIQHTSTILTHISIGEQRQMVVRMMAVVDGDNQR